MPETEKKQLLYLEGDEGMGAEDLILTHCIFMFKVSPCIEIWDMYNSGNSRASLLGVYLHANFDIANMHQFLRSVNCIT